MEKRHPKSKEDIPDERLENDYFFYLTYAKMCIMKLPADKRPLGLKWVLSLASRRTGSYKEKMLRNMHLSDLLGTMIMGDLSGIYTGEPPSRDQPLPLLKEEIIPFDPPEAPAWIKDIMAKGEETKEMQSQHDTIRHCSKDGKTYVASKELPYGKGAMGFVALSLDEKDDNERIETTTVKEMTWEMERPGKWHKRSDRRGRNTFPV